MFVDLSRQPPLLGINILSFFMDDFSRKCWIFFMRKKYETFSKFIEFKALIEKEIDKKVKPLRRNNGGEYVSNEFKNFYEKESILQELIAPHNPR